MVESLEWSIIEIVLLFWNKRGRFDVFGGFDYESRGMREGRKRNQTKMPNLSNWQWVVRKSYFWNRVWPPAANTKKVKNDSPPLTTHHIQYNFTTSTSSNTLLSNQTYICGSESRCRRYQCHGLGRKGS